MNISVLVPTRNRPTQLGRLVLSAQETAFDPDGIEFCFYVDDDDIVSEEAIKNLDHKNVKYVRSERIIMADLWNKAAELATAPILMHAGDDLVFRSKDWDKIVMDTFKESKDKLLFVFGRDGSWDDRLGTHGFLHRNWVDTVGYFTPPYFSSNYCDVWLNEVSAAIGRRVYKPEIFTEHLHYTSKKSELDDTYRERLARDKRDNCNQIYVNKGPERLENIKKLQHFIDNYGK